MAEQLSQNSDKQQISGMSEDELVVWLKQNGYPAFRGRQLFAWLHKQAATDFEQMTNLPQPLRDFLQQQSELTVPRTVREQVSAAQDTAKLLLEFADGVQIEVVIMLYHNTESRDRQTVCISTQAGCAMGCRFCATGLCGFERNLSTAEIVAQVLCANRWCRAHGVDEVSNVVFMGMGEPLLNLAAVVKSFELLNHANGQNIGGRRMAISTCGIVPQMDKLASYNLPLTLAVSLHAPNDQLRSSLMPVNNQYNLTALIAAARRYAAQTGRRITYEYALFDGVNDDAGCAEQLARLLRGSLCHVNLIAANYVSETAYLPSPREKIKQFAFILDTYGIEVSQRQERGADIAAACGQLRRQQ